MSEKQTYEVYLFFARGNVYSLTKATKELDIALSVWQTSINEQPYDMHVIVSKPDQQVHAFYSPWIGKFGEKQG